MVALRTRGAWSGSRAPAQGLWGSCGQHVTGRNALECLVKGLCRQRHLFERYSSTVICALLSNLHYAGSAQEKTGAMAEAVITYSSVIPWLSSTSPASESTQSSMWTENLLVRLCQLSDQSSGVGANITPTEALATYRYWARYWDATSKSGGSAISTAAHHRRRAWKAYYDTLSRILRHDLDYEPESAPAASEKPPLHTQTSLRLRQRAELKRVETVYEGLLIKETQFPRASEINHEMEAWVDSVMDNWRLLCGPTWRDADLGEGGKEGIARSVLDVSGITGIFSLLNRTDVVLDTLSCSHQDFPFHPDSAQPLHRARIAS
jgi:hypothetical protein